VRCIDHAILLLCMSPLLAFQYPQQAEVDVSAAEGDPEINT
jgi:hypothetical protein